MSRNTYIKQAIEGMSNEDIRKLLTSIVISMYGNSTQNKPNLEKFASIVGIISLYNVIPPENYV